MERDGFACRDCLADKKTLNVHHSYYEKGRKPWEYPDESLSTLCEDCHRIRHEFLNRIQHDMGQLPIKSVAMIQGFTMALMLEKTGVASIY